jgi:hypothetical protein
MKLEFSRQIFEKAQISSFIKILPMGAELLDADRKTDMTKLTVAFRNFANVPNKEKFRFMSRQVCYFVSLQSMISGSSAVTTAWRVLRLRMEERPADMEGSCEYFE